MTQHTPSTAGVHSRNLDAIHVLWADGLHALCTKQEGKPFQVVGFFTEYEELFERAALLPEGSNIWWNVHGMARPSKPGRGGVDDVTQIIALSADYDWADENAHKGTDLPSEADLRGQVAEMFPEPTVIINSGHGLQLYWVLQEPLGRDEGQGLIDGFFRYMEAETGLHNDRSDIASILRLPGTINNKSDCEPVEVVVEKINDVCYEALWLEENCWLEMTEPEVITPPAPKVDPLRSTSPNGSTPDETPSTWFNREYANDIPRMLVEGGWLEVGGESWVRPGKNPRDGSSAELHENGTLVVFSTGAPQSFLLVGKAGKAGTLILTPSDVYAAVHYGGDWAAAMRFVGQTMMPRPEPMGNIGSTVENTSVMADHLEIPSTDLNLPPEFWESRPYLTQIRDAAYSRLCSPDATLVGVLARVAAMVPPSVQLPAIVGSTATLDFIGCVVASSSGGKTASNNIAAELVPNKRKDILMDASPGSGEGLISAFMGYEKDDKNKNTGDPSYKFGQYQAIHLTADEGSGLMEQQSRKGTTIIQTLCTAWSGGGMGQLNASIETKRFIPAKKRRVTATINIQTGFGHILLDQTMKNVGFPQRIVFGWAHTPLPAELPDFGGPLQFTTPPTILSSVTEMHVDSTIVSELRNARIAVMTGEVELGELDGHKGLARLKVAALLAILDSRTNVDASDWDLSAAVLHSHEAVRNRLLAVKKQADKERIVTQGTAQGLRDDAAKEAQRLHLLTRAVRAIEVAVRTHGPIKRKALKDKLNHDIKKADVFNPAITELLDSYRIKSSDEGYHV